MFNCQLKHMILAMNSGCGGYISCHERGARKMGPDDKFPMRYLETCNL